MERNGTRTKAATEGNWRDWTLMRSERQQNRAIRGGMVGGGVEYTECCVLFLMLGIYVSCCIFLVFCAAVQLFV